MGEAEILKRTMTDRADISRMEATGDGYRWVYRDLPCALSRNYHGSRPRNEEKDGMAESDFYLMLYLPKGTVLQAGDSAAVRREGQILRGRCSASLSYPSYALASMDVKEVEATA